MAGNATLRRLGRARSHGRMGSIDAQLCGLQDTGAHEVVPCTTGHVTLDRPGLGNVVVPGAPIACPVASRRPPNGDVVSATSGTREVEPAADAGPDHTPLPARLSDREEEF